MNRVHLCLFGLLGLAVFGVSAEAQEPLFDDLPFGVFVEKCDIIPPDQTAAIGRKLGGGIKRLSNSVLKIHGTLVPVNVIEAKTDADAGALHRALSGMKSNKIFAVRKGRTVVEYPGDWIEAGTAIKASYELGLVPKPKKVHYKVVADIGTVRKTDYMATNQLFNLFLSPGFKAKEKETMEKIRELSEGFEFGSSLDFRTNVIPKSQMDSANWPIPSGNGGHRYSFVNPPKTEGIPFVKVTLEPVVDDTGLMDNATQTGPHLLAATPRWPVDDPEIVALAKRITSGKRSDREKVDALLEWLAPGKNLKHAGPTGSRWGVKKALELKFGHCWDASDIFVTLARASGVPSRQVAGWLFGSSGHVWAEYLAGDRWQQVDPSGAGKLDCGIYHIPWFTTDNGEMPILYLSMPEIDILAAE